VKPLLENINQKIDSVSADGAYDSDKVYEVISAESENNVVIAIPPRKDAALSVYYKTDPTARDHNILFAEEYGKYKWQVTAHPFFK